MLKYSFLKGESQMNFKNAIFDMDGTLIDSLIFWDILWSKLGKKYLNNEGFHPFAEDDKAVRTLTLKDGMALIHKKYGIAESADSLLEETNNAIVEFYTETVELKSGVKEFLDYCYNQGTKMCIASATATEFIKIALKRCGIEKYFSGVFSCADIGIGKEKPDIFLIAKEHLGSNISETWIFDDSLVAVKTAKVAGFNVVGIYDRFNFGQDEIEKSADIYINNNETLLKFKDL